MKIGHVVCLFVCLFLGMQTVIRSQELTPLLIGMEGNYPPFDKIEPSGRHIGFEPELLESLCDVMQRQCQIITQTWPGIITGLKANKYDMALAAINVTDKRKKQISFSNPYYISATTVIGLKGLPSNINDLTIFNQATVGVQVSTSMALYAEKYLAPKGAVVRSYDSAVDSFLDLVNGRVDYILIDKPLARRLLEKNKNTCCTILGDISGSEEPIAVGINSKNKELQFKVNQALDRLKKNGTYDKLYKKYFE